MRGRWIARHHAAERAARGSVEVLTRAELAGCAHWRRAFARERKDRRYYEIVEDTILQGWKHHYFAIKDEQGGIRAIQPFFILDQDILAGANSGIGALVQSVRWAWPRFMRLRTLMVGCIAGEGHLDGADDSWRQANAQVLA